MQLPIHLKKTDSSGETLLQPTGNSRLQKCVISIQSYVYNEMIKLLPMKVPVKKYSDVDWIRQTTNTELTSICASSLAYLIFSCFFPLQSVSVREKHNELINAQRCVCVCVCVHTWFVQNV